MGHYAPMPRGRWVLTSLIPFGWVTWAGFLYAGFRARKAAWVVAGFAYLAVTVATLFITSLDDNEDGLEDNLGYILMFSAWGVGILHVVPHPQALPAPDRHARRPGAGAGARRRGAPRLRPRAGDRATPSSPARR